LDEELKKLAVALAHKEPKSLEKILAQVNQIVAGTHMAAPIQPPEVKKHTKGRPPTKKAQSTSTKRNASAFEVVEEELKKAANSQEEILGSFQTHIKASKNVEISVKTHVRSTCPRTP
jgi:hypothetical protein